MEPGSESPPKRSVEHWFVLLSALLVPVGYGLMAVLFDPDGRGYGTHEQLGLPPCTTMALWDIPCPGCGVTTSMTLAAEGRFLESFVNQPFGFALSLAGLAFTIWAVRGHLTGRDLYQGLCGRRFARIATGLLAVAAISWVYKLAAI